MRKLEPNTVLVALMPTVADWSIALNEHWYRIPVDKAPSIVRDRSVKHIAFYFPKAFGAEAYRVMWYAEVLDITEHLRADLLPAEALLPKANEARYKVTFGALQGLPKPIRSTKGRRLTFVPTTEFKLYNATELNDLFNDSPLEDALWQQLKQDGVPTERQHYVKYGEDKFVLDFAVFCKLRPLAIECDGGAWHNPADRVQYDKRRDAVLQSEGWSVLRFTTDDIEQRMPQTVARLYKTINDLGGVSLMAEPGSARYLRERDDNQGRLFD